MAIVLTRIDNRLLHGVTMKWQMIRRKRKP